MIVFEWQIYEITAKYKQLSISTQSMVFSTGSIESYEYSTLKFEKKVFKKDSKFKILHFYLSRASGKLYFLVRSSIIHDEVLLEVPFIGVLNS